MNARRRLMSTHIVLTLCLVLSMVAACRQSGVTLSPNTATAAAATPTLPAPTFQTIAAPSTARPAQVLPSVTSLPQSIATPSPRLEAAPRPTFLLPPDETSPFGVTVRGESGDPAVQALVTKAGVRWVRTSVSWASVQPSPTVFRWDAFDSHLITFAELRVIPVVYMSGNPEWAASSRCGPIDRVSLSEFARFVSTLAQRYNGSTVVNGQTLPAVLYWQFYNEPDNTWTSGQASGFDGCWGQAGTQYAQMLAAAWTAVHTANPAAQVVFGGIAGESVDCPTSWECSGQAIFNFDIGGADFVDDVLDYMASHPGSDYFDVFDFHYYPSFHTRWDDYGPGLRGKAVYYRQRLAGWGFDRPLMCSEAGRRSDPGQVIDRVAGSDDEQSRYVVRLFTQGMSAGLLNVLWFTLADIVEPKQSGAAAWGLLTQSLQPKPSYVAYSTLTRELSGLRYKGLASFKGEIEGYVFSADNRETTVLWAKSGSIPVTFRGGQVTVINLQGEETTVLDGGNGDTDRRADGSVTIAATQNPVFVRRQP